MASREISWKPSQLYLSGFKKPLPQVSKSTKIPLARFLTNTWKMAFLEISG